MKLVPWRRERGLATLHGDFENLLARLGSVFDDGSTHLPELFRQRTIPPMNVAESPEALTVTVELPGLERDDIRVELMGNNLLVSGERKWKDEQQQKEFHRVESQFGSFSRTIELPTGLRLDPETLEATYTQGILTIEIPKAEPTPKTRIPVKAT